MRRTHHCKHHAQHPQERGAHFAEARKWLRWRSPLQKRQSFASALVHFEGPFLFDPLVLDSMRMYVC